MVLEVTVCGVTVNVTALAGEDAAHCRRYKPTMIFGLYYQRTTLETHTHTHMLPHINTLHTFNSLTFEIIYQLTIHEIDRSGINDAVSPIN